MSLLQSKPAVLMTFRKEEGAVMGRFLGCFLSEGREDTEPLHKERRRRKFWLNAVKFLQHRLGTMRSLVLWHYSRNDYDVAKGLSQNHTDQVP